MGIRKQDIIKDEIMNQAMKLVTSNDFNELWENVDFVDRLPQGGDLYTYPDGSQLYINELGTWLVK